MKKCAGVHWLISGCFALEKGRLINYHGSVQGSTAVALKRQQWHWPSSDGSLSESCLEGLTKRCYTNMQFRCLNLLLPNQHGGVHQTIPMYEEINKISLF